MSLPIIALLFAVGIGFFVAWFVTANGLGRDKSPDGQLADQTRRRRMSLLMTAGFAALAAALGLQYVL